MAFSQLLNNHIILKRRAKAMIRLRVCAGWSEALLIAHNTLLETSCTGSYSKNIRIYHECEGEIENSVPRIGVWHHKVCLAMTNRDSEGWIFLSYLTNIPDNDKTADG